MIISSSVVAVASFGSAKAFFAFYKSPVVFWNKIRKLDYTVNSFIPTSCSLGKIIIPLDVMDLANNFEILRNHFCTE
jgi:hypothetical protein